MTRDVKTLGTFLGKRSGILSGKEQGAKREEILLNAGIALYLGLDGLTLADGIKKAAEIIDSGAALAKLDRFAAATQEAAKA